jgi:hypothetical protein
MFVVIYNPGAGGKMVSSLIDSTDYFLSPMTPTVEVKPGSLREQLMLIHDWPAYSAFPLLKKINEENIYTAIQCHRAPYFVEYFDIDKLIFIDDSDPVINDRTLARAHALFPDVHKMEPDHLVRRKRLHGIIKIHGKKIIHMNDIMNGNLINVLKKWVDTPLNTEIYTKWLQNQKPG